MQIEKIKSYFDKAEKICAIKKLRLTEQRKRVLEIILTSSAPIKAYDILYQLQKNLEPLKAIPKPPTVYRSLEFLLTSGLIHRLNSLGAYTTCEHPSLHKECFFLVCQSCGRADECCTPDIFEAVKEASKKKKYETNSVTLEIEGICPRCQ